MDGLALSFQLHPPSLEITLSFPAGKPRPTSCLMGSFLQPICRKLNRCWTLYLCSGYL